ncbi:MAG TPA: iron ABC transporter permease [Syntrophomonas sp.]|nr:iron ABC transporter permease [Syntrophomonas sp.]
MNSTSVIESKTPRHQRPLAGVLLLLCLAVFILSIAALCLGRYYVSYEQVVRILGSYVFPVDPTWTQTMHNVVMNLRLPRILAAILVGGALALSGATYQGMFENPLVSPDILGVSSGACVGAAAAILLGLGNTEIQLFAFCGGITAVSMALAIPTLMRSKSTIALVLSGVIISGFMMALLGLMKYIADTETELADMVYWQLGSIAKVTYENLFATAPIMILTGLVLLAMRWRINILSLGEEQARTLGVNLRFERGVAITCSTLLTACAVCLSGTVGWIGLIMPHIARMIVGSDNVRLLPTATLMSAGFLILIDTVARTLTGGELPLGILTGFIGAPFFAWILIKQRGAI